MPKPRPAIDGRTRTARLLRSYQVDLIRKIGDPTLTQQFLIARAAQIQFRLSEDKIEDNSVYVALIDELNDLLSRLGLVEQAA